MATPHFLEKEKIPEDDNDLISRLPANVVHKILKKLPLRTAAKTCVLSQTWKDYWFSISNLVLDGDFWEGQKQSGSLDALKYCSIVTDILFFHNGLVRKFHLYIPNKLDSKMECVNLNPWLSFLSKKGVKKMTVDNWFGKTLVTSRLYSCTNLVELRLEFVTLNPPPTGFEGFANLRKLELTLITFKFDPFQSLFARCPRLEILQLSYCTGLDHIVIDSFSLEKLVIRHECKQLKSLGFKNIHNLRSLMLCLRAKKDVPLEVELGDSMLTLANSSQLEFLHFEEGLCKFLDADVTRNKSLSLVFDRLFQLSLSKLDLGNSDVFCCTCFIIGCCPNIKILDISVESRENVVHHNYEYDNTKKLNHLHTVKITGVKGTIAELKLIEHLVAVSGVLENLFYKCGEIDADTELKMSRELLKLPRASATARLVHLA